MIPKGQSSLILYVVYDCSALSHPPPGTQDRSFDAVADSAALTFSEAWHTPHCGVSVDK